MRTLDCKLARDLWRMRGQAAAIALVVTCAVASLVGFSGTYRSLVRSRDWYYERHRFGDVFASVRRAPEGVAERLAAIPGVEEVETRIVTDGPIEIEGVCAPMSAHIVSLPAHGAALQNRLYLREGRVPSADNEAEVAVSESLALAHRLRPGDRLVAVIEGRRRALSIVGIALSPEFVYLIRPGDILPDDAHYGVLWLGRRTLAAALDLTGAFNDVSLRLTRGATRPAVIAEVDRILGPYGGLGAYGHEQHVSDRFIHNETEELRLMAWFIPAVFLAVAAFLLQIVMARVVAAQREQIATLKALGYDNTAVGLHYLALVLVIVGAGVLLGILLGFWMGAALARMYTTSYFRLPYFVYEREAPVVIVAAAASFASALAGAGGAVRRAVRLPPAEAMRPEPPARFEPTVLERRGLTRRLPLPWRMVLRNISRRPLRTLLSTAGLALGVAILIVGAFFNDAIALLMHEEFDVVERADATVAFSEPLAPSSAYELAHLPGVLAVEPFRAVPVRLRAGHRTYRTAIVGLLPDPALRRVVDRARGPLTLPDSGLVLTDKLASILGVEPGQPIVVEVLEGRRPRLVLELATTASEYLGVSAYMRLASLERALGDAGAVSGAYLDLDGGSNSELYRELKLRPRVAGVVLRGTAISAFETFLGEVLLVFAGVLVLFAVVIAAGVVYNSGRIALAERQRDLATLRVVGLTRAEVTTVFLGDLAVQLLAALPLGVGIGYALAFGTARAMSTELIRIPFAASSGTLVFATGVVAAAAACVALFLRRRIERLDMVGVLKARE